MDEHPIQGGVEILLVTSCYRNRDKLQPDGPLGSHHRLYLYLLHEACIFSNFYFYLRSTDEVIDETSFEVFAVAC